MIDVKKLRGIDCSGDPPWRYIDDVVLTSEEQVEFVTWMASLLPQFGRPSSAEIRAWWNALSIHGLMYGRDGDQTRIEKAEADGWMLMGQAFGRKWFAVMT